MFGDIFTSRKWRLFMRTIKLYAYWANNLGDDLMIRALLERYPQCRFYCDTFDRPYSLFYSYPNFINKEKIYHRFGRLNHLLNIITFYRCKDFFFRYLFSRLEEKCCCTVYIGGSLFMQDPKLSVSERIAQEEKKLTHSPLFVIGANFGPYQTKEYLSAFETYFKKCGGICFRDAVSYELFKHLPNVNYAADVVFTYPLKADASANTSNKVLISVIDTANRESLAPYTKQYTKWIIDLCCACIERKKKPVLISFCKCEGDEMAIEEIVSNMPSEFRAQTDVVYYTDNMDGILDLFAHADRIIATRFHAMILAILAQKPLFCISYNQKVSNVLTDIGFEGYWHLREIDQIDVDEVLTTMCSTKVSAQYIKDAIHQFSHLDNFLKDNG